MRQMGWLLAGWLAGWLLLAAAGCCWLLLAFVAGGRADCCCWRAGCCSWLLLLDALLTALQLLEVLQQLGHLNTVRNT
jgi:hypothetical protein